MKKRLYLKSQNLIFRLTKLLFSDQRGAVLIAFIVTMVIAAGLGTAMVSMYATSNLNQFGSSNSMKAYYLAEAGRRYAIQYANNFGDIENTALNGQTFTLSNNDNFAISNATWVDLLEFSFRSTGTTSGGISRVLDYERGLSNNLATNPPNGIGEPGGVDTDEPFDNRCDNDGYRSDAKGPGVVGSEAYIGYDFNTPTQILRIWISQGEDPDNQINSIKVQGSNNFDFSTIGGTTTQGLTTGNFSGSDPCVDGDFQSILDLPTNLGTYRYWRLLAFAEPEDNEEWVVNELRFLGVAETQK